MTQKNLKMTEILANGYSYESTQEELSNEYQLKKYLHPRALYESSLCIGRFNYHEMRLKD